MRQRLAFYGSCRTSCTIAKEEPNNGHHSADVHPKDYEDLGYALLNLEKRIHIPNEEQVLRLFAPHQTVQERNLCPFVRGFTWVRTCYDQSLASSYAEMAEMYAMVCGGTADDVLDNPALYGNLSDDLSDLFLRSPEIFFPSWAPDTDDTDDLDYEDESRLSLCLAARKERVLVLVINEESQRRKMPKLAWFDTHGELVWWNWLQLDSLQNFSGRVWGRGDRLEWIYEVSEDVAEWRSKGAVLDF